LLFELVSRQQYGYRRKIIDIEPHMTQCLSLYSGLRHVHVLTSTKQNMTQTITTTTTATTIHTLDAEKKQQQSEMSDHLFVCIVSKCRATNVGQK